MDSKDQSLPVVLGLFAATVLIPCLLNGLGLAMSGAVLALGANFGIQQDPASLAWIGVGALVGLAQIAGGLSSAAFAVHAAVRISRGDPRLARSASMAAAATALFGIGSSVLTIECCSAVLWAVPAAFAVIAVILALDTRPGSAGPGWGAEA